MLIPVRCWSCGAMVADKYPAYKAGASLSSLGVRRYCCRRMFISFVDTAECGLWYTHEVADPPGHTGGGP